jgi:hypothetical protein
MEVPMASKEGFRRITALGRRTAIAGALLLLVAFLIRLWESRFSTPSMFLPAGFFMAPGVYLMVIGWLLLAVGWIGDGFSLTRDSENRSA